MINVNAYEQEYGIWTVSDTKVPFVESSFGQKVQSTFPVAQYRIASPFQNGANVVCVRKTNTNNFILSQAHINISYNELLSTKGTFDLFFLISVT
jgi:hypothetical protein